MKLEEAIKIASEKVKHPYSATKLVYPDALKLLIEASKCYNEWRKGLAFPEMHLLPGETKD